MKRFLEWLSDPAGSKLSGFDSFAKDTTGGKVAADVVEDEQDYKEIISFFNRVYLDLKKNCP